MQEGWTISGGRSAHCPSELRGGRGGPTQQRAACRPGLPAVEHGQQLPHTPCQPGKPGSTKESPYSARAAADGTGVGCNWVHLACRLYHTSLGVHQGVCRSETHENPPLNIIPPADVCRMQKAAAGRLCFYAGEVFVGSAQCIHP